ncbi:hypothetical protein BDM02DRAFT_3270243 [Thelephora ganbajun]|uniref:Uncharacterized protein n=1 Tax=Thelephora ganbajun TaxID=370292 RepID=A0ACB6ZDN4_THEGA|nr:hypothetical protein BDM02DRAFT_3270243 [Thelephora ganbajun]
MVSTDGHVLAYEALQFSMDIMVMFAIVAFMFFKHIREDAEPSRIPNVTCFAIIFLLSLTGAMGLTIRAASGNSFCEDFLSSRPGKCREAGLAIAMSWTSAVIAVAGLLVSWLDKSRGAAEVTGLYVPHRSVRDTELLGRQPASKLANVLPPRIQIPRPIAPHPASRSRVPYHNQGPIQPTPAPAQTLPRYSHIFPPNRVPSSLPSSFPRESNRLSPLMLHRKINGPVGQAPRNQATFMRIDDLRTLPGNGHQAGGKMQRVDEKDLWKQKFLV